MSFISMVLNLRGNRSSRLLTPYDSVYGHAAILQAITDYDAEWGHQLHDSGRNKCMTLAIVSSLAEVAKVRLSFMTGDGLRSADTIAGALLNRKELRLGRDLYEIVALDPVDPEWGGFGTWASFTAEAMNRFMCFEFVTPTAITKRGHHRRFTDFLLDPLSVFAGLARRWNALGGPVLPDGLGEFVREGGCVAQDLRGHSVTFRTSDRTQKGFVGTITFEILDMVPSFACALNALARFAFFAGVGYQTMRGMGAVRTSLSPGR